MGPDSMSAVTLSYEGRKWGTATETFAKPRRMRLHRHAPPVIVPPMRQAELRAAALRAEGRRVFRIW